MNELQIFNSDEFGSIRTVIIEDEPYFAGKDVTDVLEYQNGSRDIDEAVIMGIIYVVFAYATFALLVIFG